MAPVTCPVCGEARAACGAGASLKYPPVDVASIDPRRNLMAELDLYDVTVRGHLTQMKLTGTDAAAFGDQAKKVGAVKPAEPQPVQRPPWSADVDESGALVTSDRKKAPPAQNKARTTS